MRRSSAWHVVEMMLALAGIAGLSGSSMGQDRREDARRVPDQESRRSSPPDRTPYVRPAIPEDRMRTPLSVPERANASPLQLQSPDGDAKAAPRKDGGKTPGR
jgi:hypothetical protein